MLMSGPHRKELSGGFACTTNNRMELLAVITGLEAIKADNCQVTIYSDSKYVVDAVEKGWLSGWVKKRFRDKKNADLWMRFLEVYKKHQVRFVWIRGHSAIPENEHCDHLAVQASMGPGLPKDEGYLASREL